MNQILIWKLNVRTIYHPRMSRENDSSPRKSVFNFRNYIKRLPCIWWLKNQKFCTSFFNRYLVILKYYNEPFLIWKLNIFFLLSSAKHDILESSPSIVHAWAVKTIHLHASPCLILEIISGACHARVERERVLWQYEYINMQSCFLSVLIIINPMNNLSILKHYYIYVNCIFIAFNMSLYP